MDEEILCRQSQAGTGEAIGTEDHIVAEEVGHGHIAARDAEADSLNPLARPEFQDHLTRGQAEGELGGVPVGRLKAGLDHHGRRGVLEDTERRPFHSAARRRNRLHGRPGSVQIAGRLGSLPYGGVQLSARRVGTQDHGQTIVQQDGVAGELVRHVVLGQRGPAFLVADGSGRERLGGRDPGIEQVGERRAQLVFRRTCCDAGRRNDPGRQREDGSHSRRPRSLRPGGTP